MESSRRGPSASCWLTDLDCRYWLIARLDYGVLDLIVGVPWLWSAVLIIWFSLLNSLSRISLKRASIFWVTYWQLIKTFCISVYYGFSVKDIWVIEVIKLIRSDSYSIMSSCILWSSFWPCRKVRHIVNIIKRNDVRSVICFIISNFLPIFSFSDFIMPYGYIGSHPLRRKNISWAIYSMLDFLLRSGMPSCIWSSYVRCYPFSDKYG